jgi:hypothetical protein
VRTRRKAATCWSAQNYGREFPFYRRELRVLRQKGSGWAWPSTGRNVATCPRPPASSSLPRSSV